MRHPGRFGSGRIGSPPGMKGAQHADAQEGVNPMNKSKENAHEQETFLDSLTHLDRAV